MKRRTALKSISIGAGYAISGIGLSTLLVSCKTESAVEKWVPSFLSSDSSKFVDQIMDAYLPTTESPGFSQLNLVRVVDSILSKVYKAEDQNDFKGGLTILMDRLKAENKLENYSFDESQINGFMEKYMSKKSDEDLNKIQSLVNKERAEVSEAELEDYLAFSTISNLRTMGISTYFGSETIGMDHLNYDPIPGQYNGCIDLSEAGGKNWSL